MKTNEALAKYPELTYRKLDVWITKGWVTCKDSNPGHGVEREITPRGVEILNNMMLLTAAGMTASAAADAATRMAVSNTKIVQSGRVFISIMKPELFIGNEEESEDV